MAHHNPSASVSSTMATETRASRNERPFMDRR